MHDDIFRIVKQQVKVVVGNKLRFCYRWFHPLDFFSFHFFFLSKSSSRFGILLSPPTLKKEKDQPKKEIRGLQLKKYVGKMGRIDDLYISFCLSNRIWRKKVIFCSTLFVKFTNMYERKLDFLSASRKRRASSSLQFGFPFYLSIASIGLNLQIIFSVFGNYSNVS